MVSIDKHIDIIKLAFISFFVSLFGFSILEIRMELIVIYSKIIGIGKFKLLSFLKRFLIVSLAIILSFNTVCKPKETKAFALTLGTVATIIACVSGVVWTADMVRNWFIDNKNMNEDEVVDYFNKNVSVDGDGNYTFTNDSKLVINQMLTDYNDSVKMTYRYFFNPDNVDFSIIENKDVRDELVRVMKEYPAFHFVIIGRVANEVGQGPAFWILLNDDLEYAVCANNDLGIITKDTLYTSNWNNPVPHVKICIFDKTRDDGLYWGYQIPSKPDQTQYYASFDDIYKMYKNGELASSTYSSDYLYQLPLAPRRTTKLNLTSWRCPISADSSAINCYKSVADMKSDTGNYKVGAYTSDYTGQPNYNITTTEVNNIVNNYYNDSGGGSGSGGGSSGSDDSGSSSGIFGGLAKIVGAIVNGIASIIDAIVAPIERIISSIVGLFKDFIDAIMSFADLYDSNIPLFFKDVFSFLPDKLVTVLTTSLILVIIVAVIKFLRG